MGQNSISSFKYYFATDYMLETVLFVYCLLFINTFYLYKLDASKKNILLDNQNNNTTISLVANKISGISGISGINGIRRER